MSWSPRGERACPPAAGPPIIPLAMIQQAATLVLDLDSQIEHIDYTRANFVHADLSPEEMAEAMRRRGDDGLTLFLSITADLLRQQNLQADAAGEAQPRGGNAAATAK